MSSQISTIKVSSSTVPLNLTMHAQTFLGSLWLCEGLAASTRTAYAFELKKLSEFLQPVPLDEASEVHLREYLLAMHERGVRTAAARRATVTVRRFFSWLTAENHRQDNPAIRLVLPKLPAPFPNALPAAQTEQLLGNHRAGASEREKLRDRALLEVAYGSGLRVSELLSLRSTHLDLNEGSVRVMGKGSTERLVPLSEHALDALTNYLQQGRPAYLKKGKAAEYLFLTRLGGKMSASGFWRHLQTLAKSAGIDPGLVSPHVLRHSFATDLLRGGANLRVIQDLMGHASVGTTAVYLRQDTERLREIHQEHHPRG